MRKAIFALPFLLFFVTTVQAQTNLQLHYDFGQDRKYFTSTLEMFKTDDWGNTFFFVDYNYAYGAAKSPSETYFEIARCLKFWKAPFSAHIEYNGGLGGGNNGSLPADSYSYPINSAWLGGVEYGWHDKTFTKFLNLQLLYKYIQDKNPVSFQVTGVWNLHLLKNKVTLSGFADFWREDNVNTDDAHGNSLLVAKESKFTFISEPQFWYNVTGHLSLGGEVELSNNFAGVEGFKVCPTLAAKWNF